MMYFGRSESFSPFNTCLKVTEKWDLTKTKFEIIVNTFLKISY